MATSDFKISDISSWRHKDAAFVVRLGHACGWMVRLRENGSIQMYSQDGTQVNVPDNTSLNIGVFRSWVSKVWRHRRTTVSPKAFEELVGLSKLDRPHVKIVWLATGLESPTPIPDVDYPGTEERDDAAHRAAADAVAALVDGTYEAPAIESMDKPPADYKLHGTIVSHEPNTYKKNKSSKQEHVAEHVMKRTWSDGYIDFTCADCGHVSASPSGIGGHRVVHGPHATARGRQGAAARAAMKEEAAAEREQRRRDKDAERKRRDRERKRGEYLPAALRGKTDKLPPPPPSGTPESRLAEIARLVFPSMMEEMQDMQEQMDAAIARAEKAEGDLDALRDLLGVKK